MVEKHMHSRESAMISWTPKLTRDGDLLYKEIVRSLSEDIDRGALKQGDRLPTHRELASALCVARSTVRHAYVEAEQLGLISSRVGRGTFVGRGTPDATLNPRGGSETSVSLLLDNPLGHLGPNLQQVVCDLLKTVDLGECLRRQPHSGSVQNREAGARWLSMYGLDRGTDEVVLTSGAQHALFLTLLQNLTPGDVILTGETTYSGLLMAARSLSMRVVGLPCDEQGVHPQALEDACERHAAKAFYCTPTIHNPLSSVMGRSRREVIAEVARRHELLIIEDDALRLYTATDLPPIASLAPERTFFFGNFAKPVALGVRVAYVTAPPDRLLALSEGVKLNIFNVCSLSASIALKLIGSGEAERVIEPKRSEIVRRHAVVQDTLGVFANAAMRPSIYYWLQLPEAWDPEVFVAAAAHAGVTVAPPHLFAAGEITPRAVRFCYSSPSSQDELRRSVRSLCGLLQRGPGDAGRPSAE